MWRLLLVGLCFMFGTLHARELTDLRVYGQPAMTTLYIFTSPDCPHCRDFHRNVFPELMKKYVNTGRAQIRIVDVPGTERAMAASMLMRCLPENKGYKMMEWLYDTQSRWQRAKDTEAAFFQYMQRQGMTYDDFKACIGNKQLEAAIKEQRDNLMALYGVDRWPTIAVPRGKNVKLYRGTDRRNILYGLEQDFIELKKDK